MGVIKELKPSVVAEIAAGQVVERPASVVKELVENALDAQASQIDVELENAGVSKVVVSDNGYGMTADDLCLAPLSHATSKIVSLDDLSNLGTLGFRGEALPSIAIAGKLHVASCHKDETVGNEIKVREGKVSNPLKLGMPGGTRVTVENLFATTPARKKALKSSRTELKHILSFITGTAIAHPNVGFKVTHNGNTLLDLPASSVEDRLPRLLGKRFYDELTQVEAESPEMTLSGYIGSPALSGKTSVYHLLVNDRLVRSVEVATVVKEAYGTLLPTRLYPFFILNLEVPSHEVDINLSPKKDTVHFLRQKEVLKVIKEAVEEVLGDGSLYSRSGWDSDFFRDEGARYTATKLRSAKTWRLKDASTAGEINQLHNLYLVMETEDGVVFIDQHAAHERILYEEYKEAFKSSRKSLKIQELDKPITFDLPVDEATALSEHLETFNKLGIEIEPFGSQSFKVSAVDELFKDRDILILVREALSDLIESKETDIDTISHRVITYLACRSAIKAGDPISVDERKRLVEKLKETKNSATCPHGRPTHINLPLADIDSKFKR